MIVDDGAVVAGARRCGSCCAVTDGVDGYLARRHGTTRSGAFLDPLADKVLVLGAMVALVAKGVFWWLPVALIAVREVGISAYRSLLGRRGISVPARGLAKVKTVVQEVAVGFALLPAHGRATTAGVGRRVSCGSRSCSPSSPACSTCSTARARAGCRCVRAV